MFLGYTFDLKHINFRNNHTNKKEFDLSLYSSLLGIDLFWRQTGNVEEGVAGEGYVLCLAIEGDGTAAVARSGDDLV